MKCKTTFLLAFAIACSSVGQGEEFEGLVVRGDHKKLQVYVYNDTDTITTDEVMRAVKLRCLANGITTSKWEGYSKSPHHIVVTINAIKVRLGDKVMGYAAAFNVDLLKSTRYYVSKPQYLGREFKPEQGDYGGVGIIGLDGKSRFIEIINQYLDKFLLDYLESNIAERRKIKVTEAQGSQE